jgi:glycosyltransferase involved in cell wall biosynthesis
MLVSIAINNYNYGQFVREAIESALNQDYANCEVITVDDGSTDNSREIIEEYRGRVKVVFKSNGGQSSAFNAGFAHSNGEIIFFLDSDDYLMPNAVSEVVAHWKPGISRCHFRLMKIDSDGNRIGEMPPENTPLASGNLFERQLSRMGGGSVPTSGNAFSRAVLERIFPVDERFRICADAWIFYRSAYCGDVLAIEETLGAYRVHDSNHYAGNYVGSQLSDAKALSVFSSRLFAIHGKIDACLSLTKGSGSLYSIAKQHMNFCEMRELLLAKYLRIGGPVAELNKEFTFLLLHILLVRECLHEKMRFGARLRCLAELAILPTLPRSWKWLWVREGLGLTKRPLRKLLGIQACIA